MNTTHKMLYAVVMIAALFVAASGPAFPQDAAASQSQAPQPQIVGVDEAFRLLTAEAEKGDAKAMHSLGSMHERGIGTPRNYSNALDWYVKAANAGLAEAAYSVGVCLEIGMGTRADMAKAYSYFDHAARNGYTPALYQTGIMLLSGTGTDTNESQGMERLTSAAEAGDSRALNYLGLIAFEGRHGQRRDLNRAFEFFSQAAEMGNAEAMKNLAVVYRDGLGRAADPEQELKWYALARLAGYPAQVLNPAMEKVKDTLTGEQVRKVEAEAQVWLEAFRERNQTARTGQSE